MIRSTDLRAGRPAAMRPWLMPLMLCLLVPGVLAVGACKKGGEGDAAKDAAAKGPEAVPVEVAAVARRPIAASYTGTAPLEARADAQVVAKTSGVALAVYAEVGERVRAGEVLVRLDAARAELQAAQSAAQVGKLQANYARATQLAEEQLVSASDVDQIRYDLANARAANRLSNLEVSYASVRAPISGVIAQRSIKPGNFVQINTPIFRIVDADQLEATLNVPERELATMKPGLPVQLQVDALPGRSFPGIVDRVAPVVDAGSGTFRVVCTFENGGVLQPGMFGRIGIDYDRRANALVIPRSALLEDDAKPAVYGVRDGKAVRITIVPGYTEGQWLEVREGLEEGDAVIVAGKSAVREGSPVQVLGDEPADTPAPEPAKAAAAGAKQAA